MSANGMVHINMEIDPQHVVPESNTRNQSGLGPGYDEAAVQITPPQPANLVNTSIGINAADPEWGGSITVTGQVSNQAYGAAPATREAVVLTPSGIAPGTGSDVVIGNISVPPIPAWSSVNVEQTINLPVTPPELLANDSQFTLWVEPDADYVTNPVYPHLPSGNQGVDEQTVSITVPPGTTPPALGPLSDLAAGAVTTSASTLYWGQSFSTQAVVENLGAANPGPFDVRFVLVGASGNISTGIFLGDTTVAGLAPGATTVLNQTFTLPLRLPATVTLSSLGVGRIAEIVDPENLINESFYNNNTAESGPVTLKLMGTDGSSFVPNLPYPAQLLPVKAPVVPAKARRPIIVNERIGSQTPLQETAAQAEQPDAHPDRLPHPGEQLDQEIRLSAASSPASPCGKPGRLPFRSSSFWLHSGRSSRVSASRSHRSPNAPSFRIAINPHNPSSFREFGRVSDRIRGNLRQNWK